MLTLKKKSAKLKEELKLLLHHRRQQDLLRELKLWKHLSMLVTKPEWMILTEIPVIPPDLRPMVQLRWW